MSISAYIVWFLAASVAGWLFESLYNVVREKRWDKRGFLFGPFCPIYGVGMVAGLLLFDRPEVTSGEFPAWAVFLASMAGSAVLEYSVSVALERLFGAVWWDYSNMPLNLNGRICLPASLLFGVAGLAVAYLAIPLAHQVNALVPAAVFEAAALIGVAWLACDFTATVISLSDLMEKIMAIDSSVNSRIDEQLQQTASTLQALPGQLRSDSARAIGRAKEDGAELAARIESSSTAAAQKTQAALSAQQEKISQAARRLTNRQVRILGQFRRFRSADLRAKASLLRDGLRSGPANHGSKDGK